MGLTAIERKQMVATRCKNSVLWRAIHILGSLKLALFLLAAIAIACAVATFYEAEFSAAVARDYIYQAPWFLLWLAILCVNLFSVTLTRWPWEKKHTGFIVTHYGIITLLIGAMIGSKAGFEGNVTLHKSQPPTNRVTTSESVIQIEDPGTNRLYTLPFDAVVAKPSMDRPRSIRVPGTDWKVIAIDYAERLIRRPALVSVPDGKPGVLLELASETAGQSMLFPLLSDDPEKSSASLLGMANIRLLPALPETQKTTTVENRFIYPNSAPVSVGEKSPLNIRLIPGNRNVQISLPGGPTATYRLDDILKKDVPFGTSVVRVEMFWPDFEMVDGRPATKSEEWNNPVILVRIQQESLLAGSSTESAASPAVEEFKQGLWLLTTIDDGRISYQLWRNGIPQTVGVASADEIFGTGWNDWTARVVEISPSAQTTQEVVPVAKSELVDEEGFPGFLAYLQTPEEDGDPLWVESGKVVTLAAAHRFVRVGYGLKLENVPFTIRLVDFEVPRFEGTQTPSNFIATVEFQDPLTGEKRQDIARMNRPANWPGGILPLVTGDTYKFSQAEWNPNDLDETTLQVLYDPGWLFKWIGSLAICAGIGIMFYWKPAGNRSKPDLTS